MCVCVRTCMCIFTPFSLFSLANCFLPSLKWAVGAFQNLSITEKYKEEEEGEGEQKGGVILATRQEGTEMR